MGDCWKCQTFAASPAEPGDLPCWVSPIKPESTVQSRSEKYFAFAVGQIIFRTSRHPAPDKRGVSRSSRTLGAGCDGRFGGALTNGAKADGEVVWA